VQEVVAFLAGNLELHKAETFPREDRLLTFVADNRSPEFHGLTSRRMAVAICPYLRYRKWKEKDDNGYERLRKLK
jgi:hypothetical protein